LENIYNITHRPKSTLDSLSSSDIKNANINGNNFNSNEVKDSNNDQSMNGIVFIFNEFQTFLNILIYSII
jgi:hypothetical protein